MSLIPGNQTQSNFNQDWDLNSNPDLNDDNNATPDNAGVSISAND